MTLTAQQIANTTAAAFDVRLRYFVCGEQLAALTAFEVAAFAVTDMPPVGWSTVGDTITPVAPWVELADVVHEGTFVEQWSAGMTQWRTMIRGTGYDPAYLSQGMAICCLRRVVTPPSYDSGWWLWWLGVVDDSERHDDFRRGEAWSLTVRDVSATLTLTDSPRIVTGKVNLAAGATVTVSSTLATPAAEATNGEFVGATAAVGGDNIVDGRRATVWIGEDACSIIGETTVLDGNLVIDEVFFKPVAGYDPASAWWVEILNKALTTIVLTSRSGETAFALYATNSDNQMAMLQFDAPGGYRAYEDRSLESGERMIVCGDRRIFEAMTGGAPKAKYIFEAKSHGTVAPSATGTKTQTYRAMNLRAAGGCIAIATMWNDLTWGSERDVLVYGDGTRPSYLVTEDGVQTWTGAAVDITGIATGQSLRRSPSGTDTGTAADWIRESFPRPGKKWEPNSYGYALITLPEHTSTLAEATVAGQTTVSLTEGTTGWPSAGSGIIDGVDVFTYTGRTTTTLTGIPATGANAVGAHLAGVGLNPTNSAGEAQTGWLVDEIQVHRRSASQYAISNGSVWISRYAANDAPGTAGWESDYFHHWQITGPPAPLPRNGSSLPYHAFAVRDVPEPWVRAVLVKIDMMEDGGRPKINEVVISPQNSTLNVNFAQSAADGRAGDVIRYLLAQYTNLYMSYTDSTPAGWGAIGNLSTAIARLPAVLADLARMHGCVLRWEPNGAAKLVSDPWWPGGEQTTNFLYAFSEINVRGEWQVRRGRPAVARVALNAVDGNGNPLARVVVPPLNTGGDVIPAAGTPVSTGNSVREVSGLTVSRATDAVALAWHLWYQEQNQDWATWTVKGIGEWCRPLQRFYLLWSAADGSLLMIGQYVAEQVRYTWAQNKWACEITARRWFS